MGDLSKRQTSNMLNAVYNTTDKNILLLLGIRKNKGVEMRGYLFPLK